MKIEFVFESVYSVAWPAVGASVNGTRIITSEPNSQLHQLVFDADLDHGQNFISLDYYSKEPKHTVIEDDVIVSDQHIKLIDMRIEDILVEPWLWKHGTYYPRYFDGFLEQFPNSPHSVVGDLHWYFPGTYVIGPLPDETNFWFWYRDQRRRQVLKITNSIDKHREESHLGSLDNYQEEIDRIKKIIDV
jgi:hypothetical protein